MKKVKLLQIFRWITLILYAVAIPLLFDVWSIPYFALFLAYLFMFGGDFFCGWLCPFGGVQDLFALVAKKLKIKQKNLFPRKLHLVLLPMRYVIVILYGFGVGAIIWSVENLDVRLITLAMLEGKAPTIIALISFSTFCLLSLFYKRVFCSYFCYDAVRAGIRNLFRVFTIKRDAQKCISCGRCDQVCSTYVNVSKSKGVYSTQCVNCFKCINYCPRKGALTYGFISAQETLLAKLFFSNQELNRKQKALCLSTQFLILFFFVYFVFPPIISYVRELR